MTVGGNWKACVFPPTGLPSQAELEGIRQEPGVLADGAGEMRQRDMGREGAPWGLRPEWEGEMAPEIQDYRDMGLEG